MVLVDQIGNNTSKISFATWEWGSINWNEVIEGVKVEREWGETCLDSMWLIENYFKRGKNHSKNGLTD